MRIYHLQCIMSKLTLQVIKRIHSIYTRRSSLNELKKKAASKKMFMYSYICKSLNHTPTFQQGTRAISVAEPALFAQRYQINDYSLSYVDFINRGAELARFNQRGSIWW